MSDASAKLKSNMIFKWGRRISFKHVMNPIINIRDAIVASGPTYPDCCD
jgi:hypothetical protein